MLQTLKNLDNNTNSNKTIFTFDDILEKYRINSFSQREKGTKFERLMKNFLFTYPIYANLFKNIWLWNEFPFRKDFGGTDTGIDLVAQTNNNEFWAIQCKCYQENTTIDKAELDSFLSTSSKTFKNEQLQTTSFSYRLWISTTNKWGNIAEQTIKNQNPPVIRLSLTDLQEAQVNWSELDKGIIGIKAQKPQYIPLPHQQEAIEKICNHFKTEDRAKMIMACGTGKTFTALKIAEKLTDNKGFILFLVPSITLLSQVLKEWSQQSQKHINAICICSKTDVSKVKIADGNISNIEDLALPASTDVKNILRQFEYIEKTAKDGMTIVFSTYQSIDVISQAQKELNKLYNNDYIFDLIVCDEAHRTTGQNIKNEEEKAFTKVHSNQNIQSKKRLYMTATPRLYSENIKQKADEKDIVLWSMDDEEIYGKEVYRIGFGEAVDKQLLSDYKVLVLTLLEGQVPLPLKEIIINSENETNSNDLAKLVGCINALSKRMLAENELLIKSDPIPMHKAVAFCQTIKISKKTSRMFNDYKNKYYDNLQKEEKNKLVNINSQHIDGKMSSTERQEKLLWLKQAPIDTNECRILTNVRCLSEGIDVPSLDAVMFLAGKNSEIDIVQSVGRVMRKTQNKQYGYIIIPIIIPSNIKPENILDSNENYKIVWQVLNALRAHDDRFNAIVNKISVNRKSNHILIGGIGYDVTGDINIDETKVEQNNLQIDYLNKVQNVIYAKVVQKVGSKKYWEQWAKQVSDIKKRFEEQINYLIETKDEYKYAFDDFSTYIETNINPSLKQSEIVQMLSTYIITKPVFEILFKKQSFVKEIRILESMQKIWSLLENKILKEDNITLQRFYRSVKLAVCNINNLDGKQKIITELYNKFFKVAFQKTIKKSDLLLETPVEIINFINNSINKILQEEFNTNLSNEKTDILEPFTNTFITQLLKTKLIEKNSLEKKFLRELFHNEIDFFSYYFTLMNIETNSYNLVNNEESNLTDTSQCCEESKIKNYLSDILKQNLDITQEKTSIKIIIGTPPYSITQKSSKDNKLYIEENIDSYTKSFRWATDKINNSNGGIVGFVTKSAWMSNKDMDIFRQYLEENFTSIYIFDLRDSIRDKIYDSVKDKNQKMAHITLTILVKNPNIKIDKAKIYYYDIGNDSKINMKIKSLKKYNNVLISGSSKIDKKLSLLKNYDNILNKDIEYETQTNLNFFAKKLLKRKFYENFLRNKEKRERENNKKIAKMIRDFNKRDNLASKVAQ